MKLVPFGANGPSGRLLTKPALDEGAMNTARVGLADFVLQEAVSSDYVRKAAPVATAMGRRPR